MLLKDALYVKVSEDYFSTEKKLAHATAMLEMYGDFLGTKLEEKYECEVDRWQRQADYQRGQLHALRGVLLRIERMTQKGW